MARRSLPLIAASLLAVSLLSGCSWLSVFQVETDDLEAAEATETPENMVSMGYRLPTDISSIRDIVTIDGESTGDAVTNVENKLAASGIPFRTRGNIISGSVSSSSLQDCGVLQLRQNGDLHQLAATTPLTVLQAPGGNADDFLRREFSGNTKFTITVQPTTRGGFSATINESHQAEVTYLSADSRKVISRDSIAYGGEAQASFRSGTTCRSSGLLASALG